MKKRRRPKEISSRDAQQTPPVHNARLNAQRRKVLSTHYAARYRSR
jgi:hypothetical protein